MIIISEHDDVLIIEFDDVSASPFSFIFTQIQS